MGRIKSGRVTTQRRDHERLPPVQDNTFVLVVKALSRTPVTRPCCEKTRASIVAQHVHAPASLLLKICAQRHN